MMTQQYTGLRFVTYIVIFVFHISALFLLYNYSTKFYQEHLVQGSHGQNLVPTDKLAHAQSKEATVTFEQDPHSKDTVAYDQIKSQEESTHKLSRPAPELTKPFAPTQNKELLPQPKEIVVKQKVKNLPKEQLAEFPAAQNSSKAVFPKSEPDISQNRLQQSAKLTPIADKVEQHIKEDHYTTNAYTYAPSSSNDSSSPRSTIPPAAFFQAFKDSYYREQAVFGNPQTATSQSSTSHTKNSEYAQESLVNERLGELKIADYIQLIKKAFQDAARRTPGMYLNSGKELNTDLNVNLEIQAKGTVKVAKFQTSGISEVDEYIKKFLNDIIVAPLPKRLKVNALPFATKILININKDTRFYTLRCFF